MNESTSILMVEQSMGQMKDAANLLFIHSVMS